MDHKSHHKPSHNSHHTSSLPKNGLGLEELLRAAFARTKERFLSYFLAYILSFLLGVASVLAIALLGGANVLIWFATRSTVLTGVTAFISAIAAVLGLIYINSWTALATTYTIVAPKKTGVMDCFKTVKPLAWQYFLVMVITSLFMIGLLPFGILSLFILVILWTVWGIFTVFVFLDKKEKGLQNLFISKAIVNTKFWGVLLRVVVIYVAYFFLVYVLVLGQGKDGSAIFGVLTFLLAIFAGPFLLSYFYELYRNLDHPKTVGTNTVWKILSVIGWVIIIVGILAGGSAVIQNAPRILEQMNKSNEMNRDQDVSPDENAQQFEDEMEQFLEEMEGQSTNESESMTL